MQRALNERAQAISAHHELMHAATRLNQHQQERHRAFMIQVYVPPPYRLARRKGKRRWSGRVSPIAEKEKTRTARVEEGTPLPLVVLVAQLHRARAHAQGHTHMCLLAILYGGRDGAHRVIAEHSGGAKQR